MPEQRRFRIPLVKIAAVAVLALIAAVSVLLVILSPPAIHLFEGVSGPIGATKLPTEEPADWKAYSAGGDSRLAVLLTQEDSSWLGLAHGLKSIGVPFTVTRDHREALKHRTVLLYPTVSGGVLPTNVLRELAALPRQGGTLIASNVLGGLQEVFGLAEARESRERNELRFTSEAAARFGLSDSREITISLGGQKQAAAPFGTVAYDALPGGSGAASVLARFEDGRAAILQRDYPGRGRAVAFGLDLGALLLKAYNNREEGIARDYVNAFEPTADVLLRTLKTLYREGEERAVTLGTVPQGKSLAVILSHDVDFTKSLANAVAYAEHERSRGVRATYFIQTKYIRDWNDEIILNDETARSLRRLVELGMEVGSHTVAHSTVMSTFPLGSGDETYPSYRPFVQGRGAATSASILGELRVSKFLIETIGRSSPVVSFRPGHLSNPAALPQALEATGYRYSSSVTANTSLGHLPFRLTYDRGARAATGIFEFPITIEDEHPPKLGDRLHQALAVADKIGRYGGIFVVLIHPDILDHKLAFTDSLIEALKPKAWFGALEDLGAWWSARDAVEVDVTGAGGDYVVRVAAPQKVIDLPLQTPPGWKLVAVRPEVPVSSLADGVLIGEAEGRIELRFSEGPEPLSQTRRRR